MPIALVDGSDLCLTLWAICNPLTLPPPHSSAISSPTLLLGPTKRGEHLRAHLTISPGSQNSSIPARELAVSFLGPAEGRDDLWLYALQRALAPGAPLGTDGESPRSACQASHQTHRAAGRVQPTGVEKVWPPYPIPTTQVSVPAEDIQDGGSHPIHVSDRAGIEWREGWRKAPRAT